MLRNQIEVSVQKEKEQELRVRSARQHNPTPERLPHDADPGEVNALDISVSPIFLTLANQRQIIRNKRKPESIRFIEKQKERNSISSAARRGSKSHTPISTGIA